MSQLISKYKFFELYFSLQKTEKKELFRLAKSNILARTIEVTEFLSYLNSLDKSADYEAIIKEIVIDFKQKNKDLRRVLNYCLKTTEAYLVLKDSLENNSKKDAQLASIYRKKRLQKNLETLINKSNAQAKDTSYYHNKYKIDSEFNNYLLLTQRTTQNLLTDQSLDAYFIINKLKSACHLLMSQRMSNQDTVVSFLPEILDQIEQTKEEKIPLIQLYYKAYKTLSLNKQTNFSELKLDLKNYEQKVAQTELRDLYTYAINFCIKRLNEGESDYATEVFELYQNSLDSKALYVADKLSPFTYKNIVSAGILTRQFQWAKEFVVSYKMDLPTVDRESFYSFNLARVYFEQGDYSETLDVLRNARIKDVLTRMSSRVLEIKAFIEMDEFDLVDSLVTNLNQMIRRNKTLTYHRENYRNFGNLVKRYMQVNPYDKKDVSKLLQSITDTSSLVEKKWLSMKTQELLG